MLIQVKKKKRLILKRFLEEYQRENELSDSKEKINGFLEKLGFEGVRMKKIPEGYKETELGVIPQEWEIKQIDDVAEEIFLGLTSKVDYVENGGFPLVRASISKKEN